jgi:hypothetical protein
VTNIRKKPHSKPYYHTVTIRFTATQELNHSEIEERLQGRGNFGVGPVLRDTIEIENVEVEEGNTGDLMP